MYAKTFDYKGTLPPGGTEKLTEYIARGVRRGDFVSSDVDMDGDETRGYDIHSFSITFVGNGHPDDSFLGELGLTRVGVIE